MIRQGDRLENPITGEVLIFRETSRESGGETVQVETIVSPDGFVVAAHVHPYQTERFEVLDGRLGLRAGDHELIAGTRRRRHGRARHTSLLLETPVRTRRGSSARSARRWSSSR